MKKIINLIILVIILTIMGTACSSHDEKSTTNDVAYDRGSTAEESDKDLGFTSEQRALREESSELEDSEVDGENTEKALGDKPKLVITKYYDIETLDYEESIRFIEEQVKQLDGYIEDSEINGGSINNQYGYRSANYKVRIPKGMEDVFIQRLGDIGVIADKREKAEDVTLDYYDMESRLRTKQTQQDRLLAILDEANNLESIITLEKELAEVAYEIDSMTSQLKRLDNLINYTTIHINLQEVQEVKEVVFNPSLGEKIAKTFNNSIKVLKNILEGLLIFGIAVIPFLVVLGIIAIIILPIVRKYRKYSKAKKDQDKEENNK